MWWSLVRALCGVVLATIAACGSTPTELTTPPSIFLDFEGSSLGTWSQVGPTDLTALLRTDTNSPTLLWFSFRLDADPGQQVSVAITNATQAMSLGLWSFGRPVVSGDAGMTWDRITQTDTLFGQFRFAHRMMSGSDWIARDLPYNFSRWGALKSEIAGDPDVTGLEIIGSSVAGNPLDMVTITDATVPASEKTAVWVVARQHPGEPGGSYMVEGFLRWILGDSNAAADLRRQALVFVVPFMNPDGVIAGNQRVNLAGLDLNRQWNNPNPGVAPTVHAVQQEITSFTAAGGSVRILIDFHSAPADRSNFFFYNDEQTSTAELHGEIVRLIETAHRINPDFVELVGSTARPVPQAERGRNWAFQTLGTHGLTVESSGNDVTYGPFAGQYMTEQRLFSLGEAVARAVAEELYGIAPTPH